MKLLVAIIAGALVLGGMPRAFALPVGSPAPGFTLEDLAGETVSLEQLRGKQLLLVLGTTWCTGCRRQAIELHQIEADLEEHDVTVVDIFLQDTVEDVREFFRSLKHPRPKIVLMGNGEVNRNYQVFAIPRVLLLDQDGRIVFDRVFVPGEEIVQALKESLHPKDL